MLLAFLVKQYRTTYFTTRQKFNQLKFIPYQKMLIFCSKAIPP